MSAFQAMRCPSVTNKMNLLFKHEDKCEAYLGILSDENSDRFHIQLRVIKNTFGCL